MLNDDFFDDAAESVKDDGYIGLRKLDEWKHAFEDAREKSSHKTSRALNQSAGPKNTPLKKNPTHQSAKLSPYRSDHLYYQTDDFAPLNDFKTFSQAMTEEGDSYFQEHGIRIHQRYQTLAQRAIAAQHQVIRLLMDTEKSITSTPENALYHAVQNAAELLKDQWEARLKNAPEQYHQHIQKEIALCERISQEFDQTTAHAACNGSIMLSDNIIKILQPAPVDAADIIKKQIKIELNQHKNDMLAKELSPQEKTILKVSQLEQNIISMRKALARIEPLIDKFLPTNSPQMPQVIPMIPQPESLSLNSPSYFDIVSEGVNRAPTMTSAANRFTVRSNRNIDLYHKPENVAELSTYIASVIAIPEVREKFIEQHVNMPLQLNNSHIDHNLIGDLQARYARSDAYNEFKKAIGLYIYAQTVLDPHYTEANYQKKLKQCVKQMRQMKREKGYIDGTAIHDALEVILPPDTSYVRGILEFRIEKAQNQMGHFKDEIYTDFVDAVIPDLPSDTQQMAEIKAEVRKNLHNLTPYLMSVGKHKLRNKQSTTTLDSPSTEEPPKSEALDLDEVESPPEAAVPSPMPCRVIESTPQPSSTQPHLHTKSSTVDQATTPQPQPFLSHPDIKPGSLPTFGRHKTE